MSRGPADGDHLPVGAAHLHGLVDGWPLTAGRDGFFCPGISSTQEGGGAATQTVPLLWKVTGKVEDESGLLDELMSINHLLDAQAGILGLQTVDDQRDGIEPAGGFIQIGDADEQTFTLTRPGLQGCVIPDPFTITLPSVFTLMLGGGGIGFVLWCHGSRRGGGGLFGGSAAHKEKVKRGLGEEVVTSGSEGI